ncbi:MAG: PIN domain-containing protein [Candidatus Peregrinibacteria bacterium]|nr:PIN domain-containing protein [Candidatus Peregrinibacteria bacterium]MDZ4244338.1 PIN domain-containing protein [Candidatus Gracilibacteria bacterium]
MIHSVYVDTDVIFDVLTKREPYYNGSAKLFSLIENGKLTAYVSPLSFANMHYILRKISSSAKSKSTLKKIFSLVKISPFTEDVLAKALDCDFKDFEDAIQNFSAINCKAKCIITRNLRDFTKSALPSFSPEEFLISQL